MTNGGPTSPARQVPSRSAALAPASSWPPSRWMHISDNAVTIFARGADRAAQCRLHQSWPDAPPSEVTISGGSISAGLLAPAQNIIGGDRPIETLQIQVADVRDLYRSLDGAERALGDHDLPRACLVAQPRREIYRRCRSPCTRGDARSRFGRMSHSRSRCRFRIRDRGPGGPSACDSSSTLSRISSASRTARSV